MSTIKENNELPKTYNPQEVEDDIYKKWEKSDFFNPDNLPGDRQEAFTISMPPPNVTGILHLGHALENSLMDTAIRYQRLRGKKALLVPGTDHAAVATQARVEKDLVASKKYKNPRAELGRDKLLEVIREYAEGAKKTILSQIRQMGTSCDWSRLAYTFDEDRSRAVNEVFKKMYDDGLIYRGYRVVNWSVKGQSTCSDDEIEHQERTGKLYTFKYSKDFPITIATTRPETKLGDTAVAVNPNDKRYKDLIGQTFTVDVGAQKPLEIKIIADEGVDPEYGTGALGVTPAHSAIDFDMYESRLGQADEIKLIQVIDNYGRMTDEAGKEYQGLKVVEARNKFVEWLKRGKLLEKEEDIQQNIGTSDRFGDIVEALPMRQWFVAVNKEIPGHGKTLKELMREAVTTGHQGNIGNKIGIQPPHFEKVYMHWIDNLRDWCISRQIWWGHRLPVWYKDDKIKISDEDPGKGWTQDEDTLDTWFSSALWTFSTLGWPEQSKDLETFHPTSWMQMGHELLFFWMARMILMSTYILNEIPFKEVYIHGILRDAKGQKFSKSLRNAIDPIEVIDKYGTDALRLGLMVGISPGMDSKFYDEKVKHQKHFINKLWNIARFTMMQISESTEGKNNKPTLSDQWILSRLNLVTKEVTEHLDKYRFSQAAEKLQDFTWHEFADWYLEISKIEGNKQAILSQTLNALLKLWHPFIPFVTEHIWSLLWSERNEMKFKTDPSTSSGNTSNMLMVEKWPEFDESLINENLEKEFSQLQETVTKIRNWKAENNISFKEEKEIKLDKAFSQDKNNIIEHLTNTKISTQGKTIK